MGLQNSPFLFRWSLAKSRLVHEVDAPSDNNAAMTVRRPVACNECGTVTVTRTSIGHLDYQEFAFPCPGCAVEIRFGMTLDQKAPSFDYTLLKNGKWVEGESAAKSELRFDSENLSSQLPGAQAMPFIETVFLARDVESSRKEFGQRFSAMRTGWPIIEKMLVHEANENLELFNRALSQLTRQAVANSNLEMAARLLSVLDQFGSEFLWDEGVVRRRITALLDKASSKEAPLRDALAYYTSEQRLDSLWRQLTAIRRNWGEVYFMVAPIYWELSWDLSKASLDDYTLCQKRFEDLRGFFVDCFETFCRLSTVAAAFEGITEIDQFLIPSPARPRPVSDLELMPNGNKHTLLNQLQHGDIFIPFIDAKLRNGVGHNSAHYDITTDTIRYQNHSSSRGIEEFSISYVRFCEKLVRLYGQLEACAPLVHFLRMRQKLSSVSQP